MLFRSKLLAKYCLPIRNDLEGLVLALNSGELTDAEVSTAFKQVEEFVTAPFVKSRVSAAPADTSAAG